MRTVARPARIERLVELSGSASTFAPSMIEGSWSLPTCTEGGAMTTKDCEERPSEGLAPLDAGWRTAGFAARAGEKATSGGRLVGTSDGNCGTSSGDESRAAGLKAPAPIEGESFGAALSNVGTLRRFCVVPSASASGATMGGAVADAGGAEGGDDGALRLTDEGELTDASPTTLMLGIATTALELVAGRGSNAGLGPGAGGGRLEENADGSGGAMKAGGGVESKRSLNASCVTGALSSLSRREGAGVLRGAAGAGAGVGVERGASTAAARFCSSPMKGASSAMGSISSVRSSPP